MSDKVLMILQPIYLLMEICEEVYDTVEYSELFGEKDAQVISSGEWYDYGVTIIFFLIASSFWESAISTAGHVRNRAPSATCYNYCPSRSFCLGHRKREGTSCSLWTPNWRGVEQWGLGTSESVVADSSAPLWGGCKSNIRGGEWLHLRRGDGHCTGVLIPDYFSLNLVAGR